MSFSLIQIFFVTLCILSVFAQNVPSPDPSWDDYKVKACCPKDFI